MYQRQGIAPAALGKGKSIEKRQERRLDKQVGPPHAQLTTVCRNLNTVVN